LSKVPIKPGISTILFEVLKENVKKLKPKERYCILMFDEVNLSAEIHYNETQGKIDGFENDGSSTTQQFADHALLFMVKGITKNFKQPVVYTFVKGATNKYKLCALIKKVVSCIQETGLEIIATVCDQGTSNEGAMKIWHEETKAYYLRNNELYKEDFYEIECDCSGVKKRVKIICLFDPPHLLVIDNVRKEAQWKYLVDLFKLDSAIDDVKMLPRLTEQHVIPEKIKKIKVKMAAQIFSQRISAFMTFVASMKIIDPAASDTAEVCEIQQGFQTSWIRFVDIISCEFYGLRFYSFIESHKQYYHTTLSRENVC